MVFWVQEKARLIKVRNYWWVEQTADAAAASGSQCVVCAFCSQNLLQQISQLISELEENRGFHFMELEDEEQQPIDEKARSVDKSTQ